MPLYLDSREVVDYDVKITPLPGCRWYPVYCRPNKEKKFFEYAVAQDIPCYMPEVMRHRVTRGKKILTPVAMFNGYVFVNTTRRQNWSVKCSKLVFRILPVQADDEPKLVSELNTVRIFEDLARTRKVDVQPQILPGRRVVITRGRLKGIEGVVVKRKNAVEVTVSLDFLGCSMSTLEAYDLELI